jgi:hypothetical protein
VFQEDIARQTAPVSSAEQMQTDLSGYDPNDPAYFNKGTPTDTTQIVEQSTAAGPGRNTNLMDNQIGDYSGRDLDVQGYFDEVQLDNMKSGAAPDNLPLDDRSFLQKTKDFVFGPPKQDPLALMKDSTFAPDITDQSLRYEMAKDVANKGFIQTYGRPTAIIGAGLYGTGVLDKFFETPEPTPEEDSPLGVKRGPTGYERFMANPDDFMVNTGTTAPIYTAPVTPYGSYYDFYRPLTPALPSSRPTVGSPFYRPPVYAEKGGEIFPRRTGGIMPDEGIPGKDSVRAMLMPGEFVMTTDAVKGMGDGNLRRGIQDMYGVMANLERKGRMA